MDWMTTRHIFKPELQELFHTSTAHANARCAICFPRHQNNSKFLNIHDRLREFSRTITSLIYAKELTIAASSKHSNTLVHTFSPHVHPFILIS
ncbi:hypothetical protein GQ457_04G017980 [Hibiscus cannabinus]